MKLEVGMYVRTKWGIAKIREISEEIIYVDTCFQPIDETRCYKEDISKASHNIIDLIEVGDYVNGERVITLKKDISERNIHMNSKGNSIFVDYDLANDWYYGIDDDDIKSIVTKEQFESMSYKVGD